MINISRIPFSLKIERLGCIDGELIRFHSPITISKLLKAFPLVNRINSNSNNFFYIETGLTLGAEKQRSSFKKYDVAFFIQNGSICIFNNDIQTIPMNYLGKITNNYDLILKIKPTDNVKIDITRNI